MTCNTLPILITAFLFLVSVTADCPSFLQTREVSLTSSSDPVNPDVWYTAVNVTLLPTESSVSKLFRFIPAVAWTNLTCTDSTTSATLLSLVPIFQETKRTDDLFNQTSINMDKVPDWSLWDDRSVLVLNLYPMKWDAHAVSCPLLSLCSILGLPSTELLHRAEGLWYFCLPELTEFSTACRDSPLLTSVYPILFSVSSALNVKVDQLAPDPSLFNSTLNFVVSAGYRLPPGVFECPTGLFPCMKSPNVKQFKTLPKSLPWEQRICLPTALRCDGIANCPGSDFDEQNCDNFSAVMDQTFPVVSNEVDRVLSHLAAYDEQVLLWLSPALSMAGMHSQKSSLLLYSLLLAIPIVCLVLFVIGWYVHRRVLRPKAYSTIVGTTQNGHVENGKSYETLVVGVTGNGTGKSDLLDTEPTVDFSSSPISARTVHVERV